jgi:TAG lipase/steryl ester hydrolase/phospholipase A2/LPA acyltransferase
MADLILPARAVPVLHSKSSKSPVKSNTKAKRPPASSVPVVDTLQKAIRQANDTWQWCKDGLTEDQRSKIQQLEERKRTLCSRMQNVGYPSDVALFLTDRSGRISRKLGVRCERAR